MLLKEVRHEGKHKKLLFKVLVEEDSLVISTKCRDSKEPILIDLETIIGPYIDVNSLEQIRSICNLIYKQKRKEYQAC